MPGRADQLARMAEGIEADPPARVPLAVARKIIHCPHKAAPACACNAYATCGIGKGKDGQVTWSECVACQIRVTEQASIHAD